MGQTPSSNVTFARLPPELVQTIAGWLDPFSAHNLFRTSKGYWMLRDATYPMGSAFHFGRDADEAYIPRFIDRYWRDRECEDAFLVGLCVRPSVAMLSQAFVYISDTKLQCAILRSNNPAAFRLAVSEGHFEWKPTRALGDDFLHLTEIWRYGLRPNAAILPLLWAHGKLNGKDLNWLMETVVLYGEAEMLLEAYALDVYFRQHIDAVAQKGHRSWNVLTMNVAVTHIERVVRNLALLQPIMPFTRLDRHRLEGIRGNIQHDQEEARRKAEEQCNAITLLLSQQ